jgi:hypothetical protein
MLASLPSCGAFPASRFLQGPLPGHTERAKASVQGSVTTTAMTIQRKPGLLTDLLRLERALARACPHVLLLAQERRSSVSSTSTSMSPPAWVKLSMMRKSHCRLRCRGDQRSMEHLVKPPNGALQMMACLPHRCGHRSASSGQDRSSQQGHPVLPGRCRTHWATVSKNRENGV